jgi:hypothetical protein
MISFWGKFSVLWGLLLGLIAAATLGRGRLFKAHWVRWVVPALLVETALTTGYFPLLMNNGDRNSFSPSPPVELQSVLDSMALAEDDAVFQLPMDGPSVAQGKGGVEWDYLLWQLGHGHPVVANGVSVIVPDVQDITELLPQLRDSSVVDTRVREVAEQLDFRALVLHLDLYDRPRQALRAAKQSLGAPFYASDSLAAWKMGEKATPQAPVKDGARDGNQKQDGLLLTD